MTRARAIEALLASDALLALVRDEYPGETPQSLAGTVCDCAHMGSPSVGEPLWYCEIEADPARAVRLARRILVGDATLPPAPERGPSAADVESARLTDAVVAEHLARLGDEPAAWPIPAGSWR